MIAICRVQSFGAPGSASPG